MTTLILMSEPGGVQGRSGQPGDMGGPQLPFSTEEQRDSDAQPDAKGQGVASSPAIRITVPVYKWASAKPSEQCSDR